MGYTKNPHSHCQLPSISWPWPLTSKCQGHHDLKAYQRNISRMGCPSNLAFALYWWIDNIFRVRICSTLGLKQNPPSALFLSCHCTVTSCVALWRHMTWLINERHLTCDPVVHTQRGSTTQVTSSKMEQPCLRLKTRDSLLRFGI